MSDPIIANTNSFYLSNDDQDKEHSSFEPENHANNVLSLRSQPPQRKEHSNHHINLREALEWLLGSTPNPEEVEMSQEEKSSRRNRRMELLMWLLNLEPRLAPYGE